MPENNPLAYLKEAIMKALLPEELDPYPAEQAETEMLASEEPIGGYPVIPPTEEELPFFGRRTPLSVMGRKIERGF